MSTSVDSLPLLLFSTAEDQANAQRISRLARAGYLRKIHGGVYTSDLESPLEQIIRPNWHKITEHLYPNAVIAYRSAQLGMPDDLGNIFLVHGKRVRSLQLPGLTLNILPGAPAIVGRSPSVNDTPYGKLFVSSEARRLLENLYTGKSSEIRTMGRQWVESHLSKLCTIRGEHKINALRDDAKSIASELGLDVQFKTLTRIISALMQTGKARSLRAAGKPYDPDRIEIFESLFSALRRPFPLIADPAKTGVSAFNFAFFESYFSNYIEGTTFTVEEASEIIFDGKIIPKRNEDSHDILGTFKAIMEQPFRSKLPRNEDEFLAWLQQCNHQILSSRPDKNPGQWKEQTNQAGSTIFVHPELVKGTLREGFKRVALLDDAFARALMAMFVVTEVHPFMDGNGRTARLTMNAYLTEASACRIIVPTGYREDYLLPLKALSQNNDPTPFVRSMTRAWNWTAGFSYSDFAKLWEKMKACNAFTDNPSQYQLLDPHDIQDHSFNKIKN
jgi:hypothetical protein